MDIKLDFSIQLQPDETTCGPTCLHSIYRYYGEDRELADIIEEIPSLKSGGTLSVFLALHALRRGYKATIYTYNLQTFDPTWFPELPADILERLAAQRDAKDGFRLKLAMDGYIEFLRLGGKLKMEDLSAKLIRRFLKRDIPILTGLSATYLYRTPREFGPKADYDDIRGEPSGHFVVLRGYDSKTKHVEVADPLHPNPRFPQRFYSLPIERVVTAILLGIVTHDANMLLIEKPAPTAKKSAAGPKAAEAASKDAPRRPRKRGLAKP